MPPVTRKIAFVTGANKGIGFEVARQLAQNGCTVLLGARNAELGEHAAARLRQEELDVHFLAIDLTDQPTVEAAAKQIADDFGLLDILVNNAGIAQPRDGPPSSADLEAVQRTFAVNFFGTAVVTQAMLPLVRKSAAGRIVNVSSGLGSITHNADPAFPYASIKYLGYSGSKAALNMLTVQLAWELSDTAIKVNSADPGYTATDLNGNSGTQTIEQGAAETVLLALLPEDGPTGGFFDSGGPQPW